MMATTLEITPIIFLFIILENFEAIKKIIKVKNKTILVKTFLQFDW